MDTSSAKSRSTTAVAVRTVSWPAIVGAALGAAAALVLPHGDQGDVVS